jgi:monofunctional biosynthetic peptidoglycan transglycosylase
MAPVGAAAAGLCLLGYYALTVPDVRPLATIDPTTTAFIELRARQARRAGRAPRRVQRWAPYAGISESLKRAVLLAEDSAFWRHEGVDVEQLKESIEVNLEHMEFVRGGSTITQQLAKNLYLSPSRNPLRKLRELFIARRMERVLSKRRILELYLNVIEWGDGVYGAEAAARTYFRKPAFAVSSVEAALLAGAIVNPRLLDPANPTPRLRRRQRMILRRMGALGAPRPPPNVEPVRPRPGVPTLTLPPVGQPTVPLPGALPAPPPDSSPAEPTQPPPEPPPPEPPPPGPESKPVEPPPPQPVPPQPAPSQPPPG